MPTPRARAVLAWDGSDGAAGYRIYVGTEPRSYTRTLDARAALTLTVTGLYQRTNYFFAATAYNAEGAESDFSNELPWSYQPRPPGPTIITVTGCGLESSSDLRDWLPLWTDNVTLTNPVGTRWYRSGMNQPTTIRRS